ncbi:hypothetical protein [Streptomyces microflavus]|uniref:hypothetical protein n=1 Tax=Streptomyces microflavus TaxID=1919 RepID=UPI00365B0053
MQSFRMVLVPQCERCDTAVLDDQGREVLLTERFLPEELRDRLTAEGWRFTPGNRRLNNGPADSIAEDRLSCPSCIARDAAAVADAEQRIAQHMARPRVTTLDLSAKLGAGVTLSQRAGDVDVHCWLVEKDGEAVGFVRRYRRKGTGTFSTGWEAFHRMRDGFYRREAISSCAHSRNSNFLWSGRDVAAWGVLANPHHGAARPAWARRTTKTKETT